MRMILHAVSAISLLVAAPAALAQHTHAQPSVGKSGITITAPWARASAGMMRTGAAYLTLGNAGTSGDRLVAASTPVAGRAELHTHLRDGDVMRMRSVDAIEIPPGETAELKPGGLHIMLLDLKAPLKQGDTFPLSLQFEKAGIQTVTVSIQAAGASGPDQHKGH
jgi:copper(I)-binding protein